MSSSKNNNNKDHSSKSFPSSVNPDAVQYFLHKKKKKRTVEDFVKGIIKGDRIILSQAMTKIKLKKLLRLAYLIQKILFG